MKRAAPLLTDGGSSTASGSSGIFGISGAKKSISKLIDNVVHPSSDKKSGKLGVTSENYTLPSSMPLEPIDEQKSSSRQFDPGDSQSSHISTGATSTPYVTTPYVRSEVAMQNNVTQRKPPFAYIDLSVVSDVKAADITTEQESWAVVEVRGKARVSDRTTITQGLEIILLLDLSAHTSPSTFTSLINTVQSIMSRLSDRDDDVISMAGFNNGLQLLLSSEAATESAKESIAIILRDLQEERRGEIHTNMADHDIVRYLQGSLTYFSEDPFNLQNPRSRHVILLTSNFGERDAYTALSMSGYEDVHIHVLGLGCLYWPSATALSKTIPSGGWNFPTSPMDVSIPNYMQMRPAREIKNFIRCLRHPTELGELKDVNICITPGEHTAVKAIIGNTSFKVLRPGERTTILLRIKLFQGESHSPESDPLPAPPSSPDVEDLERELRATLGDLKMPLVTIHAFYNHSLLPRSTYLSTAAEAEVTRYRKGSIWASTEPDLISPQISKVTSSSYTHNDYVRKALMQKVVSEHRNPRRALAAVEDIASSTDAKNMDYLDLVRELRYQVALSDSKRSGKRSRVANKEIAAMRAASNEPSVAGSYGLHHTPSVTEGSPTPQPPDPDDTIPNVSQILSGSAESGDLQFKDSPKIPRKVRSVDTAGRLWEELEGQHISEHMQGTDSPGSLNTLRDVTEVEFSPWAI